MESPFGGFYTNLIMKIHKIYREQFVPKDIEQVFSFFERPENLSIITPPELNFKIITPSPIPMRQGTLIDYVIKVFGLPFRWTTYISVYEPPKLFVDVQIRGPYSFWHHTHRFFPKDKGTVIVDEVLYSLPFGFIGEIVHLISVRKSLERIFNYRSQKIREIFEQ